MRKLSIIIFLFLSFYTRLNAQDIILGHQRGNTLSYKHLDDNLIKYHLKDIRTINKEYLRIYHSGDIFEITNDSIIYTPTIQDRDFKIIVKNKFKLPNKMSFLPIKEFIKFKDIPQQSVMIDGYSYNIEIRTNMEYYNYSSLTNGSMLPYIDTMLYKIKELINTDSLKRIYLADLPSDYYRIYRHGISVQPLNKLLPSNLKKSKKYRQLEEILRKEFGINENTHPLDYPWIVYVSKNNFENKWKQVYELNYDGVLLSDLNNKTIKSNREDLTYKVGEIWVHYDKNYLDDDVKHIYIELKE